MKNTCTTHTYNPPMNYLPFEVLDIIIFHIDDEKTIKHVPLVCKKWKSCNLIKNTTTKANWFIHHYKHLALGTSLTSKNKKESNNVALEIIKKDQKKQQNINTSPFSLHNIVLQNNVELFETFCKSYQNIDYNARDTNKNTAMELAAKHGYNNIIKLLVQMGALVDTQEPDTHATPLHFAILKQRYTTCKLLLENGARADDVGDKDHGTPLHMATITNNIKITKLLLEHNANPNMLPREGSKNEGSTPLHLTSSPVIATLLIQSNAFVNVPNKDKYMPLHIAILKDNELMFDCLIKAGADILHSPPNGVAPYELENISGRMKELVRLHYCSHPAMIHRPDNKQQSPLHVAMELKDYAMIEHLLKHNACITCTDINGNNPISLASKGNDDKIMCMLINSNQWKRYINNTFANMKQI